MSFRQGHYCELGARTERKHVPPKDCSFVENGIRMAGERTTSCSIKQAATHSAPLILSVVVFFYRYCLDDQVVLSN